MRLRNMLSFVGNVSVSMPINVMYYACRSVDYDQSEYLYLNLWADRFKIFIIRHEIYRTYAISKQRPRSKITAFKANIEFLRLYSIIVGIAMLGIFTLCTDFKILAPPKNITQGLICK